MDVTDLVRAWRSRAEGPAELVAHHLQPARPASTAPYPDWVHADLRAALEKRGVLSLYAHQRRAADLLHERVHTVVADLASLDAVRSAARQVTASVPGIDVLIHNAGALVHDRRTTVDGIELTAQVHVVAPFLLTTLLLPQLQASEDGRVVFVSSGGMYTRRLDVDALEHPPEPFDGVRTYAEAKRAQVVLTDLWTHHPAGRGISFHATHPGWADTPGVQESLPGFRRVMRPLLRSPEQGADTMAWLAAAPEPLEANGAFWLDRRPRATTVLPWTRTPDGEAERLWNWCVALSGARLGIEAS